ncbi:hypothetical protein LZC95_30005 [Pendulispora brunnea]|uniref:Uncharacterized protein n=1 Tax=Pendulispora brunnea TaxID=2905690 RepID=A0ABZ2JW34_9BACT
MTRSLVRSVGLLLLSMGCSSRSTPASQNDAGPVSQNDATSVSPPFPPCRLPIVVESRLGGFVSIPEGDFVVDHDATSKGMPFSAMSRDQAWTPSLYDPVAKRWLSVNSTQIEPEHRRYAYVVFEPLMTKTIRYKSSRLAIYDLASGSSRELWQHAGSIQDVVWLSDGIHVTTVPARGGRQDAWLIDPSSGVASVDKARSRVNSIPVTSQSPEYDYGLTKSWGTVGWLLDNRGRPLVREGSRDDGASYTIFIGDTDGQRLIVHSGIQGDATGFDPTGLVPDGDALWSADYKGSVLWRWTPSSGLEKYPLHGEPSHKYTLVAGPCLPR